MKRFAALTFLGLSSLAWGHVRQRVYVPTSGTSGDGKESIIAWPLSSGVKVSMHQFSGNIGSGLTATTIDFTAARAAVGAGLAQWTGNGVTLFGGLTLPLPVDLDGTLPYATTNNCERSSSSSVDGVNNVLFTSKIDTSCASSLSSSTGVIGLTRVLYDSTTGQIVEADVQFDDKEFLFKTSGSNDISVTPKEVLLSDVVTHELGHFFGLDHTSSRSSTMLFAIAEDLHTTKTDDQLGLFSLYNPSGLSSAAGGAQGSVMVGSTPAFGAAVFALNPRTLKVNATELTDLNGAFQFCALPPGPQIAFAATYRPLSTIHSYYSGDNGSTKDAESGACFNPGCTLATQDLERSWFVSSTSVDGGAEMRMFNVPAGGIAKFVNIVGSQSAQTLADPSASATLALDSPRLAQLSSSSLPLGGKLTNVGTHVYTFVAPSSGNVQIRTASLALYTRLKLNLQLLDATGVTDVGATRCPISPGSGEAFDEPSVATPTTDIAYGRDPWLNCTGLTAGASYQIKLTGTGLKCTDIPGNASDCIAQGVEASSTAIPYYLVTVFETSKLTDTTAGGSLDASTSALSTYGNLPTCGEKSATATQTDKPSGGCCGTLSNRIPGGPSGPQSLLLTLALSPLTWFALQRAVRRLRARLTAPQ